MEREASGVRSENEQLKMQRRDLERELAESKRMIEHLILTQGSHCHNLKVRQYELLITCFDLDDVQQTVRYLLNVAPRCYNVLYYSRSSRYIHFSIMHLQFSNGG